MKDWKTFHVKYFAIPFSMLILGLTIGFNISQSQNKPIKKYPVEVQCHWSTNGYSSYPIMVGDSIKGDTLWKDGNKIVAKNIINISFK